MRFRKAIRNIVLFVLIIVSIKGAVRLIDYLRLITERGPAVVVMDAETMEPIQGAVAIAIWRKHTLKHRWFEGGTMVTTRVEEEVSDEEGKIYIKGFWSIWDYVKQWLESDLPGDRRSPHLTVYKFGYICWDQFQIFKSKEKRESLTGDRPIRVLMHKWPKEFSLDKPDYSIFSFISHQSFIASVIVGDSRQAPNHLFVRAVYAEITYEMREREKRERERKTGHQ